MEKTIESIQCPYCDGDGYTLESVDRPHEYGGPIPTPCGYCYANGRVTTQLMKEHILEDNLNTNKDESDLLPF